MEKFSYPLKKYIYLQSSIVQAKKITHVQMSQSSDSVWLITENQLETEFLFLIRRALLGSQFWKTKCCGNPAYKKNNP